MGMDFGPDGNLYVADNQYFYSKEHKSRLIRVKVQDGKATGSEVVVEGFKLANAVMFKGNAVFVSDTFFDVPGKALSGIYRIGLDEMNQGKPVKLLPKDQFAQDPHCIATWETLCNDPGVAHRKGEKAGADGLTFDAEGNLYSGNFGDGVMYKVAFKSDGSVASCTQFVKDWPRMTCVDGIFYDAKRNCIYVADSEKNAIQVVWLPEGKVTTLWENPDTDGSGGLLDQPCEPALRGNDLIVVNFDMPFPGLRNTAFDKPYTISVINVSGLQRPK
jgi:sugar lactone lactonase YvrE